MKTILTVLLCLFVGLSHADEWDSTDKKLFATSELLLLADWSQTRQVAKNPQHYSETNILLGEHPSVGKVDVYFTSVLIGNYFLTDYLESNRKSYLYGIIGVQLIVVGHNKQLGLKIGF